MFQSTYLYKVRLFGKNLLLRRMLFQSTYLYKVRRINSQGIFHSRSFNPRTYIRYDQDVAFDAYTQFLFQSTYLYKVRLQPDYDVATVRQFQSTYLYKVRPIGEKIPKSPAGFNPRTYIRYDCLRLENSRRINSFNPRTYIRYDIFAMLMLINVILFQSTYLYKVRLKPTRGATPC